MGKLLLESLEIRNFRGFRDLKIERLGRVNLIVGKNGVGKTSLLEALQIYGDKGHPTLLQALLAARGEHRSFSARQHGNGEEEALTIRHLFPGRKTITGPTEPLQVGPADAPAATLTVNVSWAEEQIDDQGNRRARLLEPGDPAWRDSPVPRLVIQEGTGAKGVYPIGPSGRLRGWFKRPEFEEIPYIFVPASGLDEEFLSRLWDNMVLTDREEDVLKALRIIVPHVERLNLLGEWSPNDERLPVVKLAGLDTPVPLRSLGEGMHRMFGIALALVNSKDGLLLVDEIDSGLHYSVQPVMWQLIFETARRLDVQVFATTHSWDCIEAFQQAAVKDKESEGMLIRLQNKNGDIIAVPFDEKDLTIATREQIEVR